ncbi:glycosyltransferase family 2 protein [Sphingomonas sp. Leaf33]|uniref:glycosyltransferase family 2 protein n=1 Tax=Sphingomonas sp. Leaf33 TaxID=1736215 RepID=UPI0009EAD6CB|nr:glycosyltransferase family 2 protein [Sphingomonas sp. Leaf33]
MSYIEPDRQAFAAAQPAAVWPTSRPLLSLIVPVKDEEAAIAPFVARVVPILDALTPGEGWEILFVDDGSTDATLPAILAARHRHPAIRCLTLSRNFGKEAALSAGLDHVRGAAVVPIDVDLQDPPEVLDAMLDAWRAGNEVVLGIRRSRARDHWLKRGTADLFYRAHNRLSRDKIPAHAGDFRLLDARVVDVIRAMPERNRFMKGLFAWGGFRQASVEYDRAERTHGVTKFNYWRLWTLALDGITSSSTMPLRVWSYVGGVVALAALAYAAVIAVQTMLFGNAVAGYPSLFVAVTFLGGVQLLSLGVLGEYVGRILIEAKGRPLYVVRDRLGFDD